MRRNDRRDYDRYELLMVRAGHHIIRELRRNGGTDEQRSILWGACELIWKAKAAYRAEQAAKRKAQGELFIQRFK